MAATFTPGPWTITKVGMCRAVHPAATSDERWDICRIVPVNYHQNGIAAADQEADATARLIAAAPDLYAALRALVEPCECYGRDRGEHGRLCQQARAALERTEG